MTASNPSLTIGELAARSGVAPSAIRFYESIGLIRSHRTKGNQRRFAPAELRRVSVIRAAQALGVSLEEIRTALEELPRRRTPTARDWSRMSKAWKSALDERIARLERLRDRLTSCIGCGCLSLQACNLFNPDDRAGDAGPGPRWLIDD
ncbi:MAG: redox-sensitive transcriptional activator SoxR [Acidobacteria bacterium]|nr:redox-sensitive transcriptional activator SoxR [Acidobacteriota bacterium]